MTIKILEKIKFLEKTQIKRYSLPIPGFKNYFMTPCLSCDCNNKKLLNFFLRLRRKYSHTFINDKNISLKSTKTWYKKNLINIKNKILFVIKNNYGENVGHLGFNNYKNNSIEIDNVIIDPLNSKKNLSRSCLYELIKFGKKKLKVKYFYLKVVNTNYKAINFYFKNNFYISNIVKIKSINNKKNKKNYYYLMKNLSTR
jgi:ribosomal protein S18 acetylase RimI-like enzyme